MSIYKKIDQEVFSIINLYKSGKISLGTLVEVLQTAKNLVVSLEDKDFQMTLCFVEGEIDSMIAENYGEQGYKDMYLMYNDSKLYSKVIELLARIEKFLGSK